MALKERPGTWRPRPESCTWPISLQSCDSTASAQRARSPAMLLFQATMRWLPWCAATPMGSVTIMAAPLRARLAW